ncbi:DNA-binding transcriptional regulator, GntR family [Paracidovorax cattleyae]|uniref:DNA-binding transcriptional regulator, GntR family n=2 Tax=Paracidovorax cattleyae TaxID=80868 RepID=A0A1H0VV21_9BURK|nr:DNA-binding transcriptional regulator, GntR family [Paracidovorax cattleyae]
MAQSNYRANVSSKIHSLMNHPDKLLNNLILIIDGDYPHAVGACAAPARCGRQRAARAAAGARYTGGPSGRASCSGGAPSPFLPQPMSESPAQNLTDRVSDQIRRRIVAGELAPGQRLSEAALAESLEISRNTLREVFRLLTKEGLLKHEPNRGVSVAVPSIASIIDIYRVRRLIECQALAQAYPRHPAKKHLREAVDAAVRCRDAGDWQGVGTANMEFHMAVVELADSERLNVMFSHLLAELRLAFGLLNDAEFLHAPYVEMNVKIVELFEAGKLQESSTVLHDYLVHSERIVLAVYARRISEPGLERGAR